MVRLTSGPPPDNEFARHAERLFKGYGETELFSGAVLVPRGDRVLFQKAAVLANADIQVWNTVESRFGIAAITHLFTIAAILRLQGGGEVTRRCAIRCRRGGGSTSS